MLKEVDLGQSVIALGMGSKQLLISLVGILLVVSFCSSSIYPEGEDKASWDARINAKIDQLHKRDVTISVALTDDEVAKAQVGKIQLRVNQTRTPIPFGNT